MEGQVVKSVCKLHVAIVVVVPEDLPIQSISIYFGRLFRSLINLLYVFLDVNKLSVTYASLRVDNCLTWIIAFPRKWEQFPGHNIAISNSATVFVTKRKLPTLTVCTKHHIVEQI